MPGEQAEASPKADTLREDTCSLQGLLLRSPVTSRLITKVKSQHGTTEKVLSLLREIGFLQKEPQDLTNTEQEKSGEHTWEWILRVLSEERNGTWGWIREVC